ncbi:MAG: pilus assembly protein PilP [Rhodocyclaceae bacterium]|nr:pilus assembly protein PilP [Rhodocyclaceae bacterium]
MSATAYIGGRVARLGRYVLLVLAASLVSACSDPQQDIEAWMSEQTAGMKGRVEPLPAIKPAETVEYTGYDYPDPFRPASKEVQVARSTSAFRPDLTRRREPLEAYPLETLTFVGVLQMEGETVALIRVDGGAGPGTLYQVRRGNYMGQDFGMVAEIGDTELTLKELVEDLNGEWGERLTTLQIQETQEQS